MVSGKILALFGLIGSPTLASTPQGYGYGDMTDTIAGASTNSPASTDLQPSSLAPTITDSITVTKPVTVTYTSTLTISGCGSGKTTTIDGTLSTTLTTTNTVFVSVPPSPEISTETTAAINTITGPSISAAASSITPVSPISSLDATNTATSCDSTITTADIDGATGSFSINPSSTFLLSVTATQETASTGVSGTSRSTAGIPGTHTSSSTVPYSTISTSMGVAGMVDARFLMGAMSLVSLVFTMVL